MFLLICILFNLSQAWSQNVFEACNDVIVNTATSENQEVYYDCISNQRVQNVLETNFRDLREVMMESESTNIEGQFFINIRNAVLNYVKLNTQRMRFIKGCFELEKTPSRQQAIVTSLGLREDVREAFIDNCASERDRVRMEVAANWYPMREGIELWKSNAQFNLSGGYYSHRSDGSLTFSGIPVRERARSHGLSGTTRMNAPTESEQQRINTTMFNYLREQANEAGLNTPMPPATEVCREGNGRFTTGIRTCTSTGVTRPASEYVLDDAFYGSIQNLPVEQRLERLKNRIATYPHLSLHSRLAGFGVSYDIDNTHFRDQYFQAMGNAPIMAYLPRQEASADEYMDAYDTFLENSEELISTLEQGSDNPIAINDLYNYKPIIEQYLAANPDQCAIALRWSGQEEIRERNTNRLRLAGAGVAITSCVAGAFTSVTGVGAALLTGCAAINGALGVYELSDALDDKNQIARDLASNDFSLTDNNFRDLASAQQRELLAQVFMGLEVTGTGALVRRGVSATGAALALRRGSAELNSVRSAFEASEASVANARRLAVEADERALRLGSSEAQEQANQAREVARRANQELIETRNRFETLNLRTARTGEGLLESYNDLPDGARSALLRIRAENSQQVIDDIPVDIKNNFTNDASTPLSSILARNDSMEPAMREALRKLGNNEEWLDYFESTSAEIYRRMLASGDDALIAMANDGNISRRVMLEFFSERFAARGLNISLIPENGGLLSFDEFRAVLRGGPVLDDAFRNGALPGHGPYPHLFQLDYVMDDMLRVANQGSGPRVAANDFFQYWGGSEDGIASWNDMFDLFGLAGGTTGRNTLRDTQTVTLRYLNRLGVVDDMPAGAPPGISTPTP